MSKSLRLSEKWFNRGLWLVALIFAGFLTGLGNTLVGDLPKVEVQLTTEKFIDQPAVTRLREELQKSQSAGHQAQGELEQAELKVRAAQADYAARREAFENWLSSRSVTQRSSEDSEVLARTRALDRYKEQERSAAVAVEAQEKIALDAHQSEASIEKQIAVLEAAAGKLLEAETRKQELRAFLYRLALTLPLLVIAGWLFAKKRKGTYWPFVWGFVLFALFAFFVELVPYLPSYGGYVRYIVGIIVTVIAGRYAIQALNRYLAQQKLAEQLPDVQRREELSYDLALARLGKGICPGCERAVDLKDPAIDFCPHCGIGLFDRCVKCTTRKSAFAPFCHCCGTKAKGRDGKSVSGMVLDDCG